MTISPRERLRAELETMTDDEVQAVLEYAEGLKLDVLPESYDPAKDPVLTGELSFEGPADLSVRTRETLKAEFGMPKTEDHPNK